MAVQRLRHDEVRGAAFVVPVQAERRPGPSVPEKHADVLAAVDPEHRLREQRRDAGDEGPGLQEGGTALDGVGDVKAACRSLLRQHGRHRLPRIPNRQARHRVETALDVAHQKGAVELNGPLGEGCRIAQKCGVRDVGSERLYAPPIGQQLDSLVADRPAGVRE